MKILFVTLGDYLSPKTGGARYTSEVLEILRQNDLEVLSLYDFIFVRSKYVRLVAALLISLLRKMPLPVLYFYSSSFERKVLSRISELEKDGKFCLILDHLELCYLLRKLNSDGNYSVVHLSHNQEQKIFLDKSGGGRFYRYSEYMFPYSAFEGRVFNSVDAVVSISETDSEYFSTLNPSVSLLTLLPTFSYTPKTKTELRRANALPKKLVYLANLAWMPNMEGLKWLISELAPVLPREFEIHVYGGGLDDNKAATLNPPSNVFLNGYVDDINEVFDNAFFSLSPMQYGAGINIKVTESLHNQVPVIVSSISYEGIPLKYTNGLIKLDLNAGLWVDELRRYLASSSEYETLRGCIQYPAPSEMAVKLNEFLEDELRKK
ncbi:glycosyltransferase [Rhodoferax aquaticus]|uniref:Glycosyltransferase n=1 Tax=Rhodoferax aquaticus TaxID=2527691 RepID=A0A515EPG4_9BURK|nr:glycosyltransferase [Rhodoferax aquaticus]QDL54552.1 glycosyltransferase [Rhodoferax aquaticus]